MLVSTGRFSEMVKRRFESMRAPGPVYGYSSKDSESVGLGAILGSGEESGRSMTIEDKKKLSDAEGRFTRRREKMRSMR